jgi:hypothetical protein
MLPTSNGVLSFKINVQSLPASCAAKTACTDMELQARPAAVPHSASCLRAELQHDANRLTLMPLQDLKFAINPKCFGQVATLSVTNGTGAYAWPTVFCK